MSKMWKWNIKRRIQLLSNSRALLDYEVKDATVEVLKSMMANYIELECKDSEDEKGRKLAIGTLGIAITELERIAQEVE